MKRLIYILCLLFLCIFVGCTEESNADGVQQSIEIAEKEESNVDTVREVQIAVYDLVSEYTYTKKMGNDTTIVIGRKETSDIVLLGDNYVSRTHCQLNYVDGKIYLTDLDSTNGTFVKDGEEWIKIDSTVEIKVGDYFMLAERVLRLESCETK